jgi:hypothetical protein
MLLVPVVLTQTALHTTRISSRYDRFGNYARHRRFLRRELKFHTVLSLVLLYFGLLWYVMF